MLIDLTHIIHAGMPVYPGDEETVLLQSNSMDKDGYTNHLMTINMHAGTHIDGPMHLVDSSLYMSGFPLDTFIGDGCLLDVSNEAAIQYKEEYEHLIGPRQIVVLYTGHSQYYGQPQYFTDYPVLTEEFTDLLIRKQVKMIGLDTPSPDKYPFDVHKRLFHHNILIAENLTNVAQLRNVESFEIIALPLHIKADSSIARIIARVK